MDARSSIHIAHFENPHCVDILRVPPCKPDLVVRCSTLTLNRRRRPAWQEEVFNFRGVAHNQAPKRPRKRVCKTSA